MIDKKEYNKIYMRKYNQEKVICKCGIEMVRGAIYKHKKTGSHLKGLVKKGLLIVND